VAVVADNKAAVVQVLAVVEQVPVPVRVVDLEVALVVNVVAHPRVVAQDVAQVAEGGRPLSPGGAT
jgi:hypothetical protein